MAKYYATISGLPNIGVEDRKLPFSSKVFVEELKEVLSHRDFALLQELRWEEENKFIIAYLEDPETALAASQQPELFTYEQLQSLWDALKKEEKLPKHPFPPYVVEFLSLFVVEKVKDDFSFDLEEEKRIWPRQREDKLTDLFYSTYALASHNKFLAEWSHLNLDIRNYFAALTSRIFGWDPKDYVIGATEAAEKLKHATGTQLPLTEEDIEFIAALNSIQNEQDITRRERMIDVLKWHWLEDKVFDRPFEIETILAYYLQLRIIERWTELNEQIGEETFRSIVATLKKESNSSLNEFKRNQKK